MVYAIPDGGPFLLSGSGHVKKRFGDEPVTPKPATVLLVATQKPLP